MRLGFIVLIASAVALQSCSEDTFSGAGATRKPPGPCIPSKKVKCNPGDTDKPDLITDDGDSHINVVDHEAVFAVRSISCALCHARVESSVISDFANKTGAASAAQTFSQMIHLKLHGLTNATKKTSISGNFIIPEGNTSMRKVVGDNCQNPNLNLIYQGPIVEASLKDKLSECVESKIEWGAGSQKFVTRKTVEINPTSSADKIKEIAAKESDKLTSQGFAAVGTSTISGISGSKAAGFKSQAAVSCEGAIVFDGPVLIKDNTTITTQKGCRIYSTRSIFVVGALTVSGPADAANLQLLSPVFVGFDIPADAITGRINHPVNENQSFSIGSAAVVNLKILADALLFGEVVGKASSANYAKIAASAPVVYAKNSGSFSGVIIAEQFIGKIGSLSFKFDPIFNKSATAPKLFPEIKDALVSVSKD
jgi:hypothetical protein